MLLLTLILGYFLASLARAKGYSPFTWFFGGAFIGYAILAFLPDTTPIMGKEKEGAKTKRKVGNGIGIGLTALTLMFDLGLIIFVV